MRVPRTFVFVDLSGFTNYTAAFGDDAAGRILSTFRGIVRTVASDRGVRIAKWLGDGCMIVAVDQRDAIEFVLDLEQPRHRRLCAPHDSCRSGHRPRAAVRGRRLHRVGGQHGRTPLRLCPWRGGAHADDAAASDCPRASSAEPYGEVELRGFPGPIDVVSLVRDPALAEPRRIRTLDPVAVHLSGAPPRSPTDSLSHHHDLPPRRLAHDLHHARLRRHRRSRTHRRQRLLHAVAR